MVPLKISHIQKSFGKTQAVQDVSLELNAGEIFGLLGPNGAGKTTIISSIVGLENVDHGSIEVFGHNVEIEPKKSKALLGYVPQEIISHGYFNVEEVMVFFSGYYGYLRNKPRIEELLKRLELWEHRHKKVKQLSGGMKRRLLIAKALVHRPKLLLLDEPTAGVDIELRAKLWHFVRELKAEGTTVLLTTHYLEEAESLCDRVGILQKGKLCSLGDTKKLIAGLTKRQVVVSLTKACPVLIHPYLLSQSESEMIFLVPHEIAVGELLSSTQLDLTLIGDLQIREGNLEDAFLAVLGGQNV